MPKRSPERGANLPTKTEVIAFLERETEAVRSGEIPPRKIGKREIARAFGLKDDARIELKRILRELKDEGAIAGRSRSPKLKNALPPMVVADVVGRDPDGELLARPSDWDGTERGPAPKILIHTSPRSKHEGAAPGVGDRALIRIEASRNPDGDDATLVGRVVKLLAKSQPRLLGVLRGDVGEGFRVIPVSKKGVSEEMLVPESERGGAEDGELVAIEPIGRRRTLGPQIVRVVERLGSTKSERAVSTIAILAHAIPFVFPPAALAEAAAVAPAVMAGREDWRSLPFITIDPPDAKDHDDAVHARADDAPDNPGGFIVSVAIADVACLVTPGSAMDREALERGNSVYFPDRVVPMLPERVSTDLGSLRPGEERPALAVRLVLGPDGRKKRHSMHRVMIRSAANLHYAQTQEAVDGRPDAETAPLLETVLQPLWEAFRAAAKARGQRSPLDLDLPERKIVLDPAGMVERVVVPVRLDAHRLIEEFMILANVAAAETLEQKQQMLVYRVHDEPSPTKLAALSEFLATIGIKLAKGQVMRPAQFNGILARVKGTEHEHLVNEVVLRSQAQAEYHVDNYGHFGLNLHRYAHFTSPIRRYADLIVHRALIRALALGRDGLPDYGHKELGEVAAKISAAERRAMAAERETIDRLIAAHLADRIGHVFEARVSGVTRSGLFVKLAQTGADGFVPAATLGDEYFRFEESAHALVGTRTRRAYRLGDVLEVKLVEAAPLAGALRFEIVGERARANRKTGSSAPKDARRKQKQGSAGASGVRKGGRVTSR